MTRIFFIACLFSFVLCNEDYYSYEKIDETLHAWKTEFGLGPHPSTHYPESDFGIIYHLDTLGYSSTDSLPIFGVKLSANANIDEAEPRVLIIGQCHAEEIYGVEIAMEIIDQFLHPENHSQNRPKFQMGLYFTELWVVPTINPEGLRVVHGYVDASGNEVKDATFRKNKTDVFHHGNHTFGMEGVFDYLAGVGQDIDGVDLNRNFDFNWNFGDSLLAPTFSCNSGYKDDFDYYRGSHPNSESEVQVIMDLARKHNFVLSIAYHSSRSGCIDRYVIYPWAWKDKNGEGNRQYAPGFSTIEKLGMEIAEISGMDKGQNYGHTGSSYRKGNAHDWFYRETGCIQYLVEVGYTPNFDYGAGFLIESDYLNEVLESNMNAFFHLLMRAAGQDAINALGESTDANQVVGIVSDVNSNEPILDARIKILQLEQGDILHPRKTDKFGYYCRILHPNDEYTMIVSAYGYMSDTLNIEHSSAGPTTKNIFLHPLNRHDVYVDVKSSYDMEVNSRLIFKGAFKSDTMFFPLMESINLPEDHYEVILSSAGYATQISTIDLVEEKSLLYFVLNEDMIYQKADISFIDDSDSLIFSLGNLNAGDSLMIIMDVKYELEFDYDYFKGYYVNLGDSISFMELNGGDYHYHEKFISLILPNDHSNGHLCFILENDDRINYRGVHLNELKILQACQTQLGDVDGDNEWNVIDVMVMVNCVLSDNCDMIEHNCSADMNNDNEWNAIDVIALANCILYANC